MDQRTLLLSPRGSYGFGMVLAYLRSSPSAIVERVTAHGFRRALDIGPGVVASIEREELLPSPDPLRVTIQADHLTPDLIDRAVTRIRALLLLDVEGTSIENHLADRDPALRRYIQQYRGFRPILLGSPWEALLWAIVGQLIGVEQARAIKERLVTQGAEAVWIDGVAWPLPPNPAWVLRSGVDALRRLGLSRIKAEAIYGVADAVRRGGLDLRPDPPAPTIKSTLSHLGTITGIGSWTTAIVALRGYGQLDVLPDGDASLQSIVARHQSPAEVRLTAKALRVHGAIWSPYRGWATYLWWLQLQAEALARRAEAIHGKGGVHEDYSRRV